MTERLSEATLSSLPPAVARPAYDRGATTIGIVHLGPGAFHRAHQAVYVDSLLARDPRWAIAGVSLQSAGVFTALDPQQGLYTLAELGLTRRHRVIGSIREVLVASRDGEAVLQRIAAVTTRMVTMTVTEKGYCLTADGDLDFAHPDIRHDLAQPAVPLSAIGWLVAGLARRRAAALPGLTILSCDNLADNGIRLRRAVLQLAGERDPQLSEWIATENRFPRTMVDSITPATDATLLADTRAALGLADEGVVQREPFTQWVIEDQLGPDSPDFAAVGATVTSDVDSYVRAKLRLLNGAHSTLAYLGLQLGHETVAAAMADPALASFVERMMREEIAPSLPRSEIDLDRYIGEILQRFRNPGIQHRLVQIALDGTQKLPFRLLATIAGSARPVPSLLLAVAGWMRFVATAVPRGTMTADPLAAELAAIAGACTGVATDDVPRFLALPSMFPEKFLQAPLRNDLQGAYQTLADRGVAAAIG